MMSEGTCSILRGPGPNERAWRIYVPRPKRTANLLLVRRCTELRSAAANTKLCSKGDGHLQRWFRPKPGVVYSHNLRVFRSDRPFTSTWVGEEACDWDANAGTFQCNSLVPGTYTLYFDGPDATNRQTQFARVTYTVRSNANQLPLTVNCKTSLTRDLKCRLQARAVFLTFCMYVKQERLVPIRGLSKFLRGARATQTALALF